LLGVRVVFLLGDNRFSGLRIRRRFRLRFLLGDFLDECFLLGRRSGFEKARIDKIGDNRCTQET
jgi:hypothetical protein